MLRLLVLSLTVLCCVRGSLAICGDCITSCNDGQCCRWDNPPIETDPDSLILPNRSPLGFTSAFLPSVDAPDDAPFPCVSVDIPENKLYYIQVAIESSAIVCVYEKNNEDEPACGPSVPFCNPNGYSGPSTVEFQFGCDACQAVETQFFFRVETEAVDMADEYWCDNANTTRPSDLIQEDNTAFSPSDIAAPSVFTGASPLLLISPALLFVIVLIASAALLI